MFDNPYYFKCDNYEYFFCCCDVATAQLPVMSSTEKVVLIEEQMKTIQKKWVELKTEVNNLDRKRRKARKKEREGKKSTNNRL